jgi:ribose-phosphate pyrophosphokinase
MATSYKKRGGPNEIEKLIILGNVKSMHVIVIDDMVDTAGTLCKISQLAMLEGAKSVTCYATHPVLSGKAAERIQDSPISIMYVANTIPLNPLVDKNHFDCITNKIEVVDAAPLFATAIQNIHNERSVSSLFEGFRE